MRMPVTYLAYLALILAWHIPNHYFPWTAYHNELFAFVALLLFGLAWTTGENHWKVQAVPLAILCAVCLLPPIQLLLGITDSHGDVWISVAYLACLSIAYIIGHRDPADGSSLVIGLAHVFVVGAVASTALALHQWLRVDIGIWLMDMRPGGRPYANLAQPNNLGTLLLFGIAATALLRGTGAWSQLSSSVIVIFLLFGVALTQSRTAVLGLIVLCASVFIVRGRSRLSVSNMDVAVTLAVFGLLVLFLPQMQSGLSLQTGSMVERGTGSPERITLWMQLIDAALRQPWLGYGWNQVGPALVLVAPDYEKALYSTYSHNLFIDLVIWSGIPIGLLLVAAILSWIGSRCLSCNNANQWFSLSCIVIFGVHAMLEFPHTYSYFLIPVGLLAGVVDRDRQGPVVSVSSRSLWPLTLVGWALLLAIFVEYRAIEDAHRRMRFETARIGSPQIEAAVPHTTVLVHLADFIRFARTEATENMSDDELDWMLKVAHRNAHPPALFRYALALGLNHRYEEASVELNRLKVLYGPDHYLEAQDGWNALSVRYPQLNSIVWP